MTKKSGFRAAVTNTLKSGSKSTKDAAADEREMHAAAMRFLKQRGEPSDIPLTPLQKRMQSGGA